ncbi:biotin/lipoyl-binding protein [Paludibacterium denitrificans]|uniref:biotin/lipoyl-binding protein n=1 Tax=Paludibacterium denitrificans TaxID=2675226 RepID=UPI001E52217E|nr:biotin/lipoyl-binding protein [Paludibacterium denitrificans]
MKHLLQGAADFIQRYRQAFRGQLVAARYAGPAAAAGAGACFPACSPELTDSPVSPVPRWSMRIIVALFLVAMLWACVGQLDVVAVANGKTPVGGRTKVIQPLETAVVKAIYVKDGQHVKAGQLLIELDSTSASADYQKADEALDVANLAAARYQSLLTALQTGQLPQLGKVDGVTETQRLAEETLAVGQWQAFQAKREALNATLQQRQAELNTTRQQVAKLEATVKIAQDREKDYRWFAGG